MAAYRESDVLSAIEAAARRLGYQLRPKQQEAVVSFVSGRDVFVSLPTGSGKSLIYSVLPWTFDSLRKCSQAESIVLVVSPLIAIMKDQVASLTQKGITAMHIVEEMKEETVEAVHEGRFQVLFFSPEILLTDEVWRDMLLTPTYTQNVVGFVVDEAHCVKKW